MKRYEKYIEINKRKGFPRSYWFNQFVRWFVILMSCFAIVYAFWFIINQVTADSQFFYKFVPFLILFFASNSLLQNLLSLNRIRFTKDAIRLDYIFLKSKIIPWQQITSLSLQFSRPKALIIEYQPQKGDPLKQQLTLAFPAILEIIHAILEMTPQAKKDEHLTNLSMDVANEAE